MEVHRRNFDVRVRSVLVEQNRTPSMVCHKEPIRQKLVVQIFNCFLQGDGVPFSRHVFFGVLLFRAEVLGSNCKC